jgi:hypothetical protein
MRELSPERVAEWEQGARKVLADPLPAGHKLWKSWAYDLADQVLALASAVPATREEEKDQEGVGR